MYLAEYNRRLELAEYNRRLEISRGADYDELDIGAINKCGLC